jgi:DNA-directed RNA polymerase specialized sigma24 family protein
MPTYTSDTLLFEAFQLGEPRAEKAVFYRFFKRMCFYAGRITKGATGTEDIVLESFEKAWEKRANYRTLADFQRYLYWAVQCGCRKDNEGGQQRAKWRADLLQEIHGEIEQLPDYTRQSFQLIFVHQQSTDEVVAQLGTSAPLVRSHKFKSIQLIRTRLLQKGLLSGVLLLYSRLDK